MSSFVVNPLVFIAIGDRSLFATVTTTLTVEDKQTYARRTAAHEHVNYGRVMGRGHIPAQRARAVHVAGAILRFTTHSARLTCTFCEPNIFNKLV